MSNHTNIQIEKSIMDDNINNGIINLFKLGKDTVSGAIENLFNLGKDKTLEYVRSSSEPKEKKDNKVDKANYYKPLKIDNSFSSNYIEPARNGNSDKTLLLDDYLDKIRPYLNDLIENHKTQGEWKIQLTEAINFVSSKDSSETRTIHTKSDNAEILIGNETNEIMEDLFDSFLLRYQKN